MFFHHNQQTICMYCAKAAFMLELHVWWAYLQLIPSSNGPLRSFPRCSEWDLSRNPSSWLPTAVLLFVVSGSLCSPCVFSLTFLFLLLLRLSLSFSTFVLFHRPQRLLHRLFAAGFQIISALEVLGRNQKLKSNLRLDGEIRDPQLAVRVLHLVVQVFDHLFQDVAGDVWEPNDVVLRLAEVPLQHRPYRRARLHRDLLVDEEFMSLSADQLHVHALFRRCRCHGLASLVLPQVEGSERMLRALGSQCGGNGMEQD
mmetsp:Transcript_15703/g.43373  ORF Transcript_15703/g.43373 Transcript_15703/m.43373 type:complete len:256 (+) Transcript_15703:147-914(+)